MKIPFMLYGVFLIDLFIYYFNYNLRIGTKKIGEWVDVCQGIGEARTEPQCGIF